jgi:hypothetical protein
MSESNGATVGNVGFSSGLVPPSAVGSEYAFEQAQPTAADFVDVPAF